MPPFTPNEPERLAALRSYHILDTLEEKDFDELTKLASSICQTPISLISLVDANRQWFKSREGLDVSETEREYSFCAHAITGTEDIMIVPNAKQDERFADNPLVVGPTNITFYAGVPLVNEDGFALGSLCVIDHQTRQLTDEQVTALKVLAKQVVDKLELKRKLLALERSKRELQDSNVLIQGFASMAAHDIKNPLSTILATSQALNNKMQVQEYAGAERLIELNISSAKNLLGMVEEMLAYSKDPSLLLKKKKQVKLIIALRKIISLIQVPANFEIILPEETATLNVSVVALEQIFINLLSNAIRYNDKEKGVIYIRFRQDEEFYYFEVEDNGIGIAEEYYQHIFTNNFTLNIRDRDNQSGTGIGLATVKNLVNSLHGDIAVQSSLNKGSVFSFRIKK